MEKFEYKTTCEWVKEYLDAYLDGELATQEASWLEGHLRGCPSCSEELELARQVKHTLSSLPEQQCPDRVVDATLRELGFEAPTVQSATRQPRNLALLRWGWRVAAIAAMLLIVVAAALVLRAPQRPSETVSPEQLARAEQQLEVTFAFIGHIGYQSVSSVQEEVLEARLVPAVTRALFGVINTEAVPWKYLKS